MTKQDLSSCEVNGEKQYYYLNKWRPESEVDMTETAKEFLDGTGYLD